MIDAKTPITIPAISPPLRTSGDYQMIMFTRRHLDLTCYVLYLDCVLSGPPRVCHPQDVLIALVRLLEAVHPQHGHVLVLRRLAPGS